MSTQDILKIITNEDGKVDVNEAVARLSDGCARQFELGGQLSVDEALRIMQQHQDNVNEVLATLVVNTQAAVVQLQDGLSQVLTGEPSVTESFDPEEEAFGLTQSFELFRLGRIYDALEESVTEQMLAAEEAAAAEEDNDE